MNRQKLLASRIKMLCWVPIRGAFREYANINGDFFRQIAQAKRVDVLRNGKKQSIKLPGDMDMLSMIKTRPYFVEPFVPAQVDSVMSGSPAAKAGMKAGDVIKSINGKLLRRGQT